MELHQIVASKDREQVAETHEFSRGGVSSEELVEDVDWDAESPWLNSRFTHLETGKRWIVYLADQAWPSEVRVLKMESKAELKSSSFARRPGARYADSMIHGIAQGRHFVARLADESETIAYIPNRHYGG